MRADIRDEILELLKKDPSFREEIRRQILTDDLLSLPVKFDHLMSLTGEIAAILRDAIELIKALTRAQAQTETQIQKQGEQIRMLTEQVSRHNEQIGAIMEQMRLLTEQVSRHNEQIGALIERMTALTEQVSRLSEQVGTMTEQVSRHNEQIGAITEQIRSLTEQTIRNSEQIGALTEQVARHNDQIMELRNEIIELTRQVRILTEWQIGEDGRRRGERYEREIVRRAPALFNGGEGGSPDQYHVQRKLTEMLGSLLEEVLDDDKDPFLADLIWWKGDKVALVEVSIQVNSDDVMRAAKRAEVLRRAGVDAMAVVVGERWLSGDTREKAMDWNVEWKVGSDLSPGFLAFRKIKP